MFLNNHNISDKRKEVIIEYLAIVTENQHKQYHSDKLKITDIFNLVNHDLECIWDNHPVTRF